jgi:hypothetical protein
MGDGRSVFTLSQTLAGFPVPRTISLPGYHQTFTIGRHCLTRWQGNGDFQITLGAPGMRCMMPCAISHGYHRDGLSWFTTSFLLG